MRRLRIIMVALFLSLLGAIMPMIIAFWLSWLNAINEEEQLLLEYTNRMRHRAHITTNLVRQIFTILNKENFNPSCSKEQIRRMKELNSLNSELALIAYFKEGREACNSYGKALDPKFLPEKGDFILSDGLRFYITKELFSNLPTEMVTVRNESNYVVYIAPNRFSDIILPADVQAFILYKGKVISSQVKPSDALLQDILKNYNFNSPIRNSQEEEIATPILKLFSKKQVLVLDNYLVSISQLGPFYFVATDPIAKLYKRYRTQLFIWLPFGLITAFFIIGLVVYYSRKKLSLLGKIKEAIKNKEFIVHYQPIIETKTEICCGAEALIRWQENGEMIPPDVFIPFSEKNGLIPEITCCVINIVFNEMEEFLSQNRAMHISINVAWHDIQLGSILKLLDQKLKKSKILPNQIWIELTEHALIDTKSGKNALINARAKGYKILVDDFGTGYSSLAYLHELSLDMLKIDKAFISSVGTESVTSNVCLHIIEMAKELNLKLIAEGVEKRAQFDYLQDYGVDYIQGYLFSKPLPKQEFLNFVAESLLEKEVDNVINIRN